MTRSLSADQRLIIALDLPSMDDARAMVDRLGSAGRFYKIGYQLFPLGGYDLARRLSENGQSVFLDLKLLDIGATVERGVRSLMMIGADILTVHADPDTIKGAVAGRGDNKRLKIFAVTVLTSWSDADIAAHGLSGSVMDLVLRRADMAARHGADGVIASAQEATAIRERFGDALEIVTPGIRPAGATLHDQKRVLTPAAAMAAGADRIVVGRPILEAADPARAARDIVADLTQT